MLGARAQYIPPSGSLLGSIGQSGFRISALFVSKAFRIWGLGFGAWGLGRGAFRARYLDAATFQALTTKTGASTADLSAVGKLRLQRLQWDGYGGVSQNSGYLTGGRYRNCITLRDMLPPII